MLSRQRVVDVTHGDDACPRDRHLARVDGCDAAEARTDGHELLTGLVEEAHAARDRRAAAAVIRRRAPDGDDDLLCPVLGRSADLLPDAEGAGVPCSKIVTDETQTGGLGQLDDRSVSPEPATLGSDSLPKWTGDRVHDDAGVGCDLHRLQGAFSSIGDRHAHWVVACAPQRGSNHLTHLDRRQ